ncbi:STAS domain-containing protein [Micromonospora sp. NPDC049559]|uniref:STAS domain-containing protein n=1 Tax=Micromonospora sp. NPDC049559 TaxID=3155923 RepID=UPI00341784C9
MGFSVTYAEREGIARLRLTGELDMTSAPEFNEAVDRLIGTGWYRLLVDLAELDFCDSIGMGALVRGDNLGTAAGGWLRITGATGRVARVLRISGLGDVLGYDGEGDDPIALLRPVHGPGEDRGGDG